MFHGFPWLSYMKLLGKPSDFRAGLFGWTTISHHFALVNDHSSAIDSLEFT